MVGPISEPERRIATRRLAAGFVGLVGLSAGMTALHGGATLAEAGLASMGGLAAGVALLAAVGVPPGRVLGR